MLSVSRPMQAELYAGNGHVTQLEEGNRRWQECNNQLLTKVVCPSVHCALVFEDADIAL